MSAMGKGWAKGLTAATDARVARAADAHRGMRYERRTPIDECAWPKSSSRLLPLEWSDTMAYLVGLTATDGCLITGRRQINFKSEDRALVDLYLTLLGRTNTISSQPTRSGGTVYHSQFGDALWYEWLRGVGLSPRKASLSARSPCPRRSCSRLFAACSTATAVLSTRSIGRTPPTGPITTGNTY